jgi:hypothetical protein
MNIMLQPNDLPLICLPTELSDESAANLVEFLHELTEALERHYFAQLRRHYSASDNPRPDSPELDPRPASSDPPF